jgi:hypothetical protein
MKHWHRLAVLTALFSLMLVSVALAALDTPTISAGISGHGKQTVYITAGATGAPNGFTVRWIDQATFLGNGGSFPTQPTLDEGLAKFDGTPTLNTFGGEVTTFALAPYQTVRVEIGDLLQETGVDGTRDELDSGIRYYYAAFANDENGAASSALSVIVSSQTTVSQNCTYTIGFWKTHEEAWPVAGLTLGSVFYTKAELLAILNESVAGNGLVSLAHQLIGAKLNIAAGADPTAAAAAIITADGLIGGLVVPPIGGGYLHPSVTSSTTQTLDDYNNGIIGPAHCGSVGTESKSWGKVKALYR